MPYIETDPSIHFSEASKEGAGEVIDHLGGHDTAVRIEHVRISDGYETRDGRAETQAMVVHMDQMLIENPDWQAPTYNPANRTMSLDMDNASSLALYDNNETLQEWFADAAQAQATALYPLQRPDADRLVSGGAINERSRAFFYHGLDAIGIRTRAKIMTEIASRTLDDRPGARWISLACGGAVPVIDALKECQNLEMVHLDLVDIDPDALSFASYLAMHEAQLQQVPAFHSENELRSYTVHEMNLIRGLIASDSLVDGFGEGSSDMVDALGIFEYFSKKDSTAFLKNAYRMVRDDGVMVIANMLSDRPQLEFNRRGVGWPKLYPRSIEEISQIIVDAGIDPEKATIIIPEDHIYAVVEIRK